ncbi:MAG: sigma-54-dependent Fis family transcriptional regulator [Planctomycetes bacterium]|nr:sigma-54-dependent Fis family transcriptional regulator [Planctomycetota bacterium]
MPKASPQATLQAVVALGSAPPSQACPFVAVARHVISSRTADEALLAVHAAHPELVVVRETFPREAALEFLQQLRTAAPGHPVVVLTDRPDVDEAIMFIRHGATDYVAATPVGDAMERVLRAARRSARPEGRPEYFAPECPADVPIVGRSEAMRQTLKTIALVAESGCNPALVVGETGTGKELAARAIHAIRGGSEDNFVAVNCAALNANLLESELFGHVKGAFTGADGPKKGLFELAGTGSILLDEVSEIPVELQAKLLRVLQDRTFRRVGGTETIPCRASILASSNRDLAAEVQAGRFRRDLYYRLAVFPVELPPLRTAGAATTCRCWPSISSRCVPFPAPAASRA